MEIVFDKTKKIILSLVLTLLFISITTSVFAADKFHLGSTSVVMYKGREHQLTPNKNNVTYKSSNEKIATVSSAGKIIGKRLGTTTITATTSSGETATCKVKVNLASSIIDKIKGLGLNISSVTAYKNQTIVIIDSIITSEIKEWKSSDENVAYVQYKGLHAAKVITKNPGKAKITAINAKGKKVTINIEVKELEQQTAQPAQPAQPAQSQEVKVSKVKLNRRVASIKAGEEMTLTATVSPDNATNKTVIWTSTNTNVATVSNGKVTAKKAGVAIISAKAGGKISTCWVTVKKADKVEEPAPQPTPQPVVKKLDSIKITKEPNKKTYTEGEDFNTAGMTVQAIYNDGTKQNISNYTVTGGKSLTTSVKKVIISYTEGGVTETAEQAITVNKKENVEALKITASDNIIGIGETVNLKVNADKKDVEWSIVKVNGKDPGIVKQRNDVNDGYQVKYVGKKLGIVEIKAKKGNDEATYTIQVTTDTYTNSDYQEIYKYTGYNTGSWASFSKLNSDYVIAIGNKKLNSVMKTILDRKIYQDAGTGSGKCNRLASYYCYLLTDQITEASVSKVAATAVKYDYDSGKDNIGNHKNEGHLQVIKNWIDQGRPVKLHVNSNLGGHWVVVVGYKKGQKCESYGDLLILGVTFGTLQTIDGNFNESEGYTYYDKEEEEYKYSGTINADKDAKVFN